MDANSFFATNEELHFVSCVDHKIMTEEKTIKTRIVANSEMRVHKQAWRVCVFDDVSIIARLLDD